MRELIDEIDAHPWSAVVISGLRTPDDAAALRNRSDWQVLLVHITVGDQRKRYRRVRNRDTPRDPDNYQDFLRQERQEEELFSLTDAFREADLLLRNDSSLKVFYQRIEDVIVQPILQKMDLCGAGP